MNKRKFFAKKVFIANIVFFIAIAMIFSIYPSTSSAYAVTHTQTTQSGIDAFPESYREALRKLSATHPNWNFTAYNTGISWQEFMNGETSQHLKNRVHDSSPSAWKCSCHQSSGGYACASSEILAYFADPRNFLTEDGIFQFMEMSYNSSVQNKKGVENILANTFMNGTVTVTGERVDDSLKSKHDGAYIYVTPGTKNSEVAETLGISKYKVTDSKNKTVSNDTIAATGYTFTNTEYNTSYTIIVLGDVDGDGRVRATDYVRVKAFMMNKTTLTSVQKKAADINIDGRVRATDYVRVKSYIMNATPITISSTTTGKTTMKYSDIIMKAAEESGISPYSIAIKIIQEVGTKGSGSVSGTYPGYEGYYNFFNWGATDGNNAIEKGLIYAKSQGWNNQYTAIIEGSKKLADSYTGVGQNTAYFYKFDVVDDTSTGLYWHQYMTNVQDPSSQAKNLYNTYAKNDILDLSLNFVIPVYIDMPNKCLLPTTIDTSASTSYYINGTDVRLRREPKIDSNNIITKLSAGETVTVLQKNAGTANGYTWSKIKRADGTEGYIANTYLSKC